MFPRLCSTTYFILVFAGSLVRAEDDGNAATVFEERIAPIFKSPNPSSCVACHLSSVDLKDYILPSSKETFLALRKQGLIDLDTPEKSKILTLINRGADKQTGPARVSAKQQKAEYEAFAAWIKACAVDPTLKGSAIPEGEPLRELKPVEVVRHARMDRVLESFERNVWAMRFRCMNCHTEGSPQNDKLRKEFGARVSWVKKEGAGATMDYLLASKLIDTKEPEKSLLLTKPLGTDKHEGGIKFAPGDQGYKAFRAWVDDVAAIKTGRYAKATDLPAKETGPKRFGTDIWFKLTNTPDAWADKLLQVNVHSWNAKAGEWEKEPVATSDRIVFGKGKLWQHNLTLLADAGSVRANQWQTGKPKLPSGKYLVKVYVDAKDRLKSDWKSSLGKDDFVGRIEVNAKWTEGYGAMTAANGSGVLP